MQWHEVNGLVVPIKQTKQPTRKPPTQKELMDMYYPMHCCCPECGSDSVEQTCSGFFFTSIETAKDLNRATCGCGWKGIVHDLVPAKSEAVALLGYHAVHKCEQATLNAEPDIGTGDVSKCLPGWIKTFCEKFEAGEGYVMSHDAVRALAHTLIAARARNHRLAKERDAALARRTRQRFWVSWVQPTADHRPLGYPPNDQVLGWWCSGYDHDGNAILCACVVGTGDTVGDQMRHATEAIQKEWPEATAGEENESGWRFFEPREANWQPNDRFPLSDWMVDRF